MLASEDEIIRYFIENYNRQWIAYFDDKKSLKSLWESINIMGISQQSLSTLYSHHNMNCFSNEKYINGFIEIQNIDKIMTALNIKDENIEKALPNALKIYDEKKRRDYNMAYASYRKKI